MIGLVRRSVASRWAGLVGSALALGFGVALCGAAGLCLVAAFDRPPPPLGGFAAADLVVAGPDRAGTSATHPAGRPGNTTLPEGEVSQVPPEAVARLATLDGVRAEPVSAGRVTAVSLHFSGTPDETRVRSALAEWPNLRLLTGPDRGRAQPDPEAGRYLLAVTLVGESAAVAAVVSAFVVGGTVTFTVAQRRREFGLLRLAGATPRQVRRLVFGEALCVGAAGGAIGSVLGGLLASPAARWLSSVGFAPAEFVVPFRWWPLAAAFGVGLLLALLGAWAGARRAGRVSAIAALDEASRGDGGRLRWIVATLCVGGTVPLLPLLSTPDGPAYLLALVLLLLIGAVALTPMVTPPVLWLLGRALRGPVGSLAVAAARNSRGRTAATAAPVVLALGLAGATLTGTATMSATQAAGLRAHVLAPSVVPGPAGPGGVPVKATLAYDDGGRMVQQRQAWYIDGPLAPRAFRFPVLKGDLADLTGESVAVTRALAEAHRWEVGSQADLWLGDGSAVRLRVAAVLEDRLGLPSVLLPWPLAARYSVNPVPDATYLPSGGIPTATYLSTVDGEFDRLSRLALLAIIGMSLAYAGISVANRQAIAASGRRPEFRGLRLAGATPGQVRRLALAEAVLATGAGALVAALVTVLTVAAISIALAPIVSDVDVVVPWRELVVITVATAILAVVGAVVPALRTARTDMLR